MPAQLIQNFNIKLATPECSPMADWYRAYVRLHEDITEVLPYLNAAFKGCDYNHNAKVLLWENKAKKYAFRPQEIDIAPVESREEAHRLVNNIISTVNDVWIRRSEIKPDFSGKKPLPKVLDIYKLLPRTNCRECGLTCMAFASALRGGAVKISLCPYLSEENYNSLLS